MAKLVSVSITGNASSFKAATAQSSVAARTMATSIRQSVGQASSSMDQAAAAAKRLGAAERIAATAAGAVRVAETKLAEVRAKGNATVAQKVKAEEALYKSARKLAAAQEEVAASSAALQTRKGGILSLADADGIDRVSSSLLKVGAAGVAGLGLAAKAAIDWESDWAGVSKTVNGSTGELAGLQDELRQMARTLPTSHHDIAAVAEAAGQLGIQTPNVAAFTKVMVELGDTTNLSADEAATSIAQFANIMGTLKGPPDEVNTKVSQLGSTIVGLGNNGASTERDIVQMALRIAGAGKQVGLSEAQVLAYSSAVASVGVTAEAGGSAVSRAFAKIDDAVREGTGKLDLLGEVTGQTGAQFRKAFQEDAGAAVNDFIVGLGKAGAAGENTNAILKTLKITSVNEVRALQALAGAGDLLGVSLDDAAEFWKQNNALVDEAAKRYGTTESQAKIAMNQIKDSAISAGQAVLPVFSQLVTLVASVAKWFGEIPEPARNAGIAIGIAVTGVALLGGAGLKAITAISSMKAAFQGLGLAATGAGTAMKIAGLAIPAVGIALFAVTTAMQFFAAKTTDAETQANSFADAMKTVEGEVTRATAAINENVRAAAIQSLQSSGAFEDAKRLGLGLGLVTDAALGNKDAINEVNKALIAAQAGSAGATRESADLDAASTRLSVALNGVANSSIDAVASERDRREAMNGATGATETAGAAVKQLKLAYDAQDQATTELRKETLALIDTFTILRDGTLGQERANQAWLESIDSVSNSVRDNRKALDDQVASGKLSKAQADAQSKSLDINTESGRRNRSAIANATEALNTKITADFKATEKTKGLDAATKQATAALKEGRRKILDSADAAGVGQKASKKYTDELLLTPKELRTQINTPGIDTANRKLKETDKNIRDLKNKSVDVNIKVNTQLNDINRHLVKKYGAGAMKIALASGGVMPGFTPGRDVHHFSSPTGGQLALSGGEAVMRPEWTRAVGGEKAVARMNRAAVRGQAFQAGGVFRDIDIHAGTRGTAPNYSGIRGAATTESAQAAAAYGKAIAAAAIKAAGATSGDFGKIDVNNPKGHTSFRGHTFTNLAAATLRATEKDAGPTFQIFQGGFRPTTSYSGTSHAGDAVDAQVDSALMRAGIKHGLKLWDRTGKGNWVSHMHGVFGPGAGFGGGSAVWQYQDYLRGGDGLATGTRSASPGVHPTAENGAELVLAPGYKLYRGGEQVYPAEQTRAIVDRSYAQPSYGSGEMTAVVDSRIIASAVHAGLSNTTFMLDGKALEVKIRKTVSANAGRGIDSVGGLL